VDIPRFTLIFQAAGKIKPALNYQVLHGLGLSHSWTPQWYSSLTYSGLGMEGSGYWQLLRRKLPRKGRIGRLGLRASRATLSEKNVAALDGQWFLGAMTANRQAFSW
jgi:hypothetical protein